MNNTLPKHIIQAMVVKTMGYKEEMKAIYENAKPTLKEITLDESLKAKLVTEVTVVANDEMYFFLKDGQLVYQGMVDSEGTHQTIHNDIEQTEVFINGQILTHMGDVDEVHRFFSQGANLLIYSMQMVKGFDKGQENGHY